MTDQIQRYNVSQPITLVESPNGRLVKFADHERLLAAVRAVQSKLVPDDEKCETCEGAGWVWPHQVGDYETDQRYTCPNCGGMGKKIPPSQQIADLRARIAVKVEIPREYVLDADLRARIAELKKEIERLQKKNKRLECRCPCCFEGELKDVGTDPTGDSEDDRVLRCNLCGFMSLDPLPLDQIRGLKNENRLLKSKNISLENIRLLLNKKMETLTEKDQ